MWTPRRCRNITQGRFPQHRRKRGLFDADDVLPLDGADRPKPKESLGAQVILLNHEGKCSDAGRRAQAQAGPGARRATGLTCTRRDPSRPKGARPRRPPAFKARPGDLGAGRCLAQPGRPAPSSGRSGAKHAVSIILPTFISTNLPSFTDQNLFDYLNLLSIHGQNL